MDDKTRLGPEDIDDLREMHDALVKALENLPTRLMENPKFGLMAVNAMFNIIATVAVNTGTEKQEILRGLEQVIDGRLDDRGKTLN